MIPPYTIQIIIDEPTIPLMSIELGQTYNRLICIFVVIYYAHRIVGSFKVMNKLTG